MAGLLLPHASLTGWYLSRLGDQGDELLGLLPGVLWLFLQPWRLWAGPATRRDFALLGALALFTVLVPLPPLLLSAALVVGAAVLTRSSAGGLGRALLALAALPSGASLEFYLSFPMRRFTAEAAAWLLRTLGTPVLAQGTLLEGPDGAVAVDSPCAGLHSLWVATVAVSGLLAWWRADLRTSLAWGLAALAAVLLANALRTALLYLILVGQWPSWPAYHPIIGLVCFLGWFLPWFLVLQRRVTWA